MSAATIASFAELQHLAEIAPMYLRLRREHPTTPARHVKEYIDSDGVEPTFEQFLCLVTRGHEFRCTGTAYGGDDERWHGEGRCLCIHCGADGDA